jgi:hypothetical protein
VKFRASVAFLILTTCATVWGANQQTTSFRVPDPEEIYEAFQEGLIDYQDYLELLEISRADFLTPVDSAFLMQFPDLLAGISSNPMFNAEEVIQPTTIGITPSELRWRQSLLFRQYFKLNRGCQRSQLFRTRGTIGRMSFYGELGHEYSGIWRWARRYIQYDLGTGENPESNIIVGSYKERFGMGLAYGYHGRFLSKTYRKDDFEKFIYPDYGGGNGVLLNIRRPVVSLKLLLDVYRNIEFTKEVAGISIPIKTSSANFQLAGVWGQLRNRITGANEKTSWVSAFGHAERPEMQVEMELAAAASRPQLPWAGAVDFRWRRRRMSLSITGWTYDTDYSAYFSGGPSSRRSRTIHIDELDLSYSDRYSDETGLVVKTSSPVSKGLTFRMALGYARREFNDDRAEARIGIMQKLSGMYQAKIDCYWRDDRLYSGARRQRRVQLDIVRDGTITRTRLVLGYRNEPYNKRDDFLLLADNKISLKQGTVAITFKLDRIQLHDLQNRYMYISGYYETELSRHFRTYIKYTYRYRKDNDDGNFGTIRLDFNWAVQ